MPTIEIVSIDSTGLNIRQDDFDVATIEENKVVSHRGLFYKFLKKQKGVIVHIGDTECKSPDYAFYGGGLIDWDFEPCEIFIPEFDPTDPTDNHGAGQQFRFKFHDQYKDDINRLLEIALDGSPIKKVYFLTDYQFGPEKGKTEIIYTIDDLWKRHDSEGLNLNTMYELYGR